MKHKQIITTCIFIIIILNSFFSSGNTINKHLEIEQIQINDTTRKSFKNELNKEGNLFRIYDNGFIRLGSKEKYFIEGKVINYESITDTIISTKTIVKIHLVYIDYSYIEGKVGFKAVTWILLNSPNERYCFFLPNATKDTNRYKITRAHEINHVLTSELLKGKEGILKQFYGEILSDILLIKNLNDSALISIRLKDVEEVIKANHSEPYYIKYLKIIQHLLKSKNYKYIVNIIWNKALKFEFNQKNIDDLELRILELINNNS